MATFKDPAFLTDCVQQRLECSNAKTGAELDGLINRAYATPADIRKRLNRYLSGGPSAGGSGGCRGQVFA